MFCNWGRVPISLFSDTARTWRPTLLWCSDAGWASVCVTVCVGLRNPRWGPVSHLVLKTRGLIAMRLCPLAYCHLSTTDCNCVLNHKSSHTNILAFIYMQNTNSGMKAGDRRRQQPKLIISFMRLASFCLSQSVILKYNYLKKKILKSPIVFCSAPV